MDNALYRIINDKRENKSQRKADDSDDIKAPGILISIMTFDLVCTLKIDLLFSDCEEIDKKKCRQRGIYTGSDR